MTKILTRLKRKSASVRNLIPDRVLGAVMIPIRALSPTTRHFGQFLVEAQPHRVTLWAAEIFALCLGLLFVWFCALVFLLSKKEVNASFLIPHAQSAFSDSFEGQTADITSIFMRWEPLTRRVELDVDDIVIRDRNQIIVQAFDNVTVSFHDFDFVSGNFEPRDIVIFGGDLTWRRDENGVGTAGLGSPETLGRFINFFRITPEDRRSSSGNLTPPTIDSGALESVKLRRGTIYLINEQTGLSLKLENAGLDAAIKDEVINIESASNPSNDGMPQDFNRSVTIAGSVSKDFQDVDVRMSIRQFNFYELGPDRGPLGNLKDLNLPLDIEISVRAARQIGLLRADLKVDGGKGMYENADLSNPIKSLSFEAQYAPDQQALIVKTSSLDSELLSFSLDAVVEGIVAPAKGFFKDVLDISWDMQAIDLNLAPQFRKPLRFGAFSGDVSWNTNGHAVDFNTLALNIDGLNLRGDGSLLLTPTNAVKFIQFNLDSSGQLQASRVMDLWPIEFITGARRWVDKAIQGGNLTDLQLRLKANSEELSQPTLPNEALSLRFKVVDGVAKYISTMTPLRGVQGEGHLQGNRFDFTLETGFVDTMEVLSADISMPEIYPYGSDFIIDLQGRGDVPDILSLIDQEPFRFASRYGIDPQSFTGSGQVEVTITRPLLEFFDESRISYSIVGDFESVSAPFSMGAFGLSQADVRLEAGKTGLLIEGPVNIGPWRTNLSMKDDFTQVDAPSEYKLVGTIDQNTLDDFGIGLRQFLDGSVDVTLDAVGNNLSLSAATITANLATANLRLGDLWQKSSGTPGRLSADIIFEAGEGIKSDNLRIISEGLDVQGQFDFAPTGRLRDIDLSDVFIEGLLDARLNIRPDSERERFLLALTGEYINVSPFTENLTSQSSLATFPPFALDAEIQRLILRDGFVLRDSAVTATHDGANLISASVSGQMPAGLFEASLNPKGDSSGQRSLIIDVPDAAFVASVVFGYSQLKNGVSRISADLPAPNVKAPILGTIEVQNFTVQQTPILTQILSLASFTGLTDTLSGVGLRFENVTVPFLYFEDEVKIRNAKAYGPALGVTADGDYNITDQALDFDGVLIPAYSANQILGGIPGLGELINLADGGGVLGVNYAVGGELSSTQISVNPVTALAPGILKRIFDVERENLEDAEARMLATQDDMQEDVEDVENDSSSTKLGE